MADSVLPGGDPVSGGPNKPDKARADYNNDNKINDRDLELQKFDKDKDGKLDKDEQKAADKEDKKDYNRDRLEADLMNSEFSWAWKIIKSNPELKQLWRDAINKGWETTRFIAKLIDSDWYQQNDGYKRTILALEKADPETYKARLKGATSKVRNDLVNMGVLVEDISDEELQRLGRRFLILGFDQGQNEDAYEDWLGKTFRRARKDGAGIGGQALSNQDALSATLLANGFDPESETWKSWINNTVNKVAVGDMALSDAQSFVREQAATAYPVFAERIRQGQDVQDIAAAYFEVYADTLEVNPSEISLRDPYLRQALQGIDETTGEPKAMGLWDFQKALRKDDRWQYTKQANSMADGLAADILSMFGFVG